MRRRVPEAGHCVDCKPIYAGSGFRRHDKCEPQNALDRIALILYRNEHPELAHRGG